MSVELMCVFLINAFLTVDVVTVKGSPIKESVVAIDVDDFIAKLAPHLALLSHQAAGHFSDQEINRLGLLEDTQNCCILKPLDGTTRTVNELKFYREIEEGKHPVLAKLVPKFLGVVSVPYGNQTVEFIALENLANGFKKTCVIDLKMGERSFLPGIRPLKHDKDLSKWRVRAAFGFAMPGCRFTNIQTKTEKIFTKEECRFLKPKGLLEAIENFVHTTGDSRATVALVKCIIRKLTPIIQWISTQTELRFLASSILILYDCEELPKLLSDVQHNPDTETDIANVKMVDFSYVYKASENDIGLDTNYLRGAIKLMKIFQDILKKHRKLAETLQSAN